jgi:hypothetical protein
MPLADDPDLLRRPIGFAASLSRAGKIDVTIQRRRLPGLLRFLPTFAGELLEKEFNTKLAGYPVAAHARVSAVRLRLPTSGHGGSARALLSVIIDLIELQMEHDAAYPEGDADEEEAFHDSILLFIERLLDRFATWADETDHLPKLAAESRRGKAVFAEAAARLSL